MSSSHNNYVFETSQGKIILDKGNENTYRNPRNTDVFQKNHIEEIMNDVLETYLAHLVHSAAVCKELCLILSEEIKLRVEALHMNRFRIICNVCIGETAGQSVLVASRFLWDESRDNFSTSTFKNQSLFAVANVFGVFKE
mgnify:CR=1 FL=1